MSFAFLLLCIEWPSEGFKLAATALGMRKSKKRADKMAGVINFSSFDTVPHLNSAVRVALEKEETAFVLIDGNLYTMVPAQIAKDRIAEKIAMRLAESPSILHDIQTRLENETPEDWE